MKPLSKRDRETLAEILKWARDEEIDVIDGEGYAGFTEAEAEELRKEDEKQKARINRKYRRYLNMIERMYISDKKG